DFTIFAMALFAIPEAIRNLALGQGAKEEIQSFGSERWMTKQDWQRSAGPWARGSVLGFIIGVLPGVGPSLASFMSYIMEKRISKRKDEFGKGAI
ncbi:tripartite tricarboxylate transporter permease, partial [Mycobacterium tuberculosis]|nr:tripartite tricarboxylate transporter permease [Mycobacterium tuberculosis]